MTSKMAQKLKVDFHTHTAEDPFENINYNAFELIDRASQKGFDALTITNHNTVTYSEELAQYAEKKEVLLIPGMEAILSDKHILIINPDFKKILSNWSLKDLSKLKKETNLIIAPHPFFPGSKSLKSALFPILPFIDAIEFCHFYNHSINCNKKAVHVAVQYKLPLIGTSDCHNIWQFGMTYTLVEAKKEIPSIIEAVKMGKVEICTTPLSLITLVRTVINFFLSKKLKVPYRL
ncbi:MAG: PHP-associated domain-containing protein [Candidatus Aminicenantaceae bacterium]